MPKYFMLDYEKRLIAENARRLTQRQRMVFERYYLDGMRIEDIAAELDVNRSTVDRDLDAIRLLLLRLKRR